MTRDAKNIWQPAQPTQLEEPNGKTMINELAKAVDELRTQVKHNLLSAEYDMIMNAETLCVHKANKNTDKNDSSTWRAMCG